MFRYKIISLLLIIVVHKSEAYVAKTPCQTPLGEDSECVLLTSCNPVIQFVTAATKPLTEQVRNVLRNFTCESGTKFTDSTVCCPSGSIELDEEGDLVGPLPKPPNVANHKNLKLLPEECGLIDIGNKVRGGTNANLNEYPWMALLLYRGEKLTNECGGTILNEKYILTAAHCVQNTMFALAGVRVGEHSLLSEKDCDTSNATICNPPVQHLLVETVTPHQDYNEVSRVHDIALLRVTKMNFEVSVHPICLPIDQEVLNRNYIGGFVTGWGSTDEKGINVVDILQKLNIKKRPMSVCAKVYKNEVSFKVTKNSYQRLCIGGVIAKDSCGGDSGGPFQVAAFYNDDERYIQRGIVSIGHRECGIGDFPAVYTNVDYYVKWILDNIYP